MTALASSITLAESRLPVPDVVAPAARRGQGRAPMVVAKIEAPGQRLERHAAADVGAERRRRAAELLPERAPARERPIARRTGPPTLTSQFFAQMIAQEVLPEAPRAAPQALDDGIAAYRAAASRTQVFLGPTAPVLLVA